jgi:hypothetical protein
MRALIAETDQQLARERAEQLQMDGHHTSRALTHHAAALKLADSSFREITVGVPGTDPDALGAPLRCEVLDGEAGSHRYTNQGAAWRDHPPTT